MSGSYLYEVQVFTSGSRFQGTIDLVGRHGSILHKEFTPCSYQGLGSLAVSASIARACVSKKPIGGCPDGVCDAYGANGDNKLLSLQMLESYQAWLLENFDMGLLVAGDAGSVIDANAQSIPLSQLAAQISKAMPGLLPAQVDACCEIIEPSGGQCITSMAEVWQGLQDAIMAFHQLQEPGRMGTGHRSQSFLQRVFMSIRLKALSLQHHLYQINGSSSGVVGLSQLLGVFRDVYPDESRDFIRALVAHWCNQVEVQRPAMLMSIAAVLSSLGLEFLAPEQGATQVPSASQVTPPRDVFGLLRRHVKKNKAQLEKVFPSDRELTTAQLRKLVQSLLLSRPDEMPLSGKELLHFMALMDADNNGKLSRAEFDDGLKSCRSIYQSAYQLFMSLHDIISSQQQFPGQLETVTANHSASSTLSNSAQARGAPHVDKTKEAAAPGMAPPHHARPPAPLLPADSGISEAGQVVLVSEEELRQEIQQLHTCLSKDTSLITKSLNMEDNPVGDLQLNLLSIKKAITNAAPGLPSCILRAILSYIHIWDPSPNGEMSVERLLSALSFAPQPAAESLSSVPSVTPCSPRSQGKSAQSSINCAGEGKSCSPLNRQSSSGQCSSGLLAGQPSVVGQVNPSAPAVPSFPGLHPHWLCILPWTKEELDLLDASCSFHASHSSKSQGVSPNLYQRAPRLPLIRENSGFNSPRQLLSARLFNFSKKEPTNQRFPSVDDWNEWHSNVITRQRRTNVVSSNCLWPSPRNSNWWQVQWKANCEWVASSMRSTVRHLSRWVEANIPEGESHMKGASTWHRLGDALHVHLNIKPQEGYLRPALQQMAAKMPELFSPEVVKTFQEGSIKEPAQPSLHASIVAKEDHAASTCWQTRPQFFNLHSGLLLEPIFVTTCQGALCTQAALGDVQKIVVTPGSEGTFLERTEVMALSSPIPAKWTAHYKQILCDQPIELFPDPFCWETWMLSQGQSATGVICMHLNMNTTEWSWGSLPKPESSTYPGAAILSTRVKGGVDMASSMYEGLTHSSTSPSSLIYMSEAVPEAVYERKGYAISFGDTPWFRKLQVQIAGAFPKNAITMHAKGGSYISTSPHGNNQKDAESSFERPEVVFAQYSLLGIVSSMDSQAKGPVFFRSMVALDDSAGETTGLTRFVVIGDSHLLWTSKWMTSSGSVDECDVEVTMFSTLKLCVESVLSSGGRAVWVDPHVVRLAHHTRAVYGANGAAVWSPRWPRVTLNYNADCSACWIAAADDGMLPAKHKSCIVVHLLDAKLSKMQQKVLIKFTGAAKSTSWITINLGMGSGRPGERKLLHHAELTDIGRLEGVQIQQEDGNHSLQHLEVLQETDSNPLHFVFASMPAVFQETRPLAKIPSSMPVAPIETVFKRDKGATIKVLLHTLPLPGWRQAFDSALQLEVSSSLQQGQQGTTTHRWELPPSIVIERSYILLTGPALFETFITAVNLVPITLCTHTSLLKACLRCIEVINLGSNSHHLFAPAPQPAASITNSINSGYSSSVMLVPVPAPYYRVTTFTSLLPEASTNARVYIDLIGDEGFLKDVFLKDTGTSFEGGKHSFLVVNPGLGKLQAVRISHDDSGTSPNWHLDHVEVTESVTGHTYIFPCGQWIGKDNGEGILERTLLPLCTFAEPSAFSANPMSAAATSASSPPTLHTMRSVSVTASGSIPGLARGSSSVATRATGLRGASVTQTGPLRQDTAGSKESGTQSGVDFLAEGLQNSEAGLEMSAAEGQAGVDAEYHMVLHADSWESGWWDAVEAVMVAGTSPEGEVLQSPPLELDSRSARFDVLADLRYLATVQQQSRHDHTESSGTVQAFIVEIHAINISWREGKSAETRQPQLFIRLHGSESSSEFIELSQSSTLNPHVPLFSTSQSSYTFKITSLIPIGTVLRVEVQLRPSSEVCSLHISQVVVVNSRTHTSTTFPVDALLGCQHAIAADILVPGSHSLYLLPIGITAVSFRTGYIEILDAVSIRHDAPGAHRGWHINKVELLVSQRLASNSPASLLESSSASSLHPSSSSALKEALPLSPTAARSLPAESSGSPVERSGSVRDRLLSFVRPRSTPQASAHHQEVDPGASNGMDSNLVTLTYFHPQSSGLTTTNAGDNVAAVASQQISDAVTPSTPKHYWELREGNRGLPYIRMFVAEECHKAGWDYDPYAWPIPSIPRSFVQLPAESHPENQQEEAAGGVDSIASTSEQNAEASLEKAQELYQQEYEAYQLGSSSIFALLRLKLKVESQLLQNVLQQSGMKWTAGLLVPKSLLAVFNEALPDLAGDVITGSFFCTMMMLGSTQPMQLQDLTPSLKDCHAAVKQAVALDRIVAAGFQFDLLDPSEAPAEAALQLLGVKILGKDEDAAAAAAFNALDTDGSGKLELVEVAAAIRTLVPRIEASGLRLLLAYLHLYADTERDGCISLSELQRSVANFIPTPSPQQVVKDLAAELDAYKLGGCTIFDVLRKSTKLYAANINQLIIQLQNTSDPPTTTTSTPPASRHARNAPGSSGSSNISPGLPPSNLRQFLQHFIHLLHLPASDLLHVQAMLQLCEGSEAGITLAWLNRAIRVAVDCHKRAQSVVRMLQQGMREAAFGDDAGLEQVLVKVGNLVTAADFKSKVLPSIDADGSGNIDPLEVLLLVHSIEPGLKKPQLQLLLAFFYQHVDTDRDGNMTIAEMTRSMAIFQQAQQPRR